MIIDILAGKMNFDGKKVSPDPRKGLLRLVIDGLADRVTLQWLNREVTPPVVETEWQGPVTVEEVPSAKSGKVYVVKPSGEAAEKQFVWIQQPSSAATGNAVGYTNGGVDNVDAVMNQIQMLAQIRSGKSALEIFSQAFGEEEIADDQMLLDLHHHEGLEDDEEYMGEDDDDEQFEQIVQHLLEASGGDSDQTAVLGLLLSDPNVLNLCIANLMAVLLPFAALTNPTLTEQHTHAKPTQVAAVLTAPEAIASLTRDDDAISARLASLCPEGQTDLKEILKSPQFSETLRSLTEGIYSENIAMLFSALGLNPAEADPHADPFATLCRLLEKKHKK